MQVARQSIKNQWNYALHKLFDHPSIVLIGGKWKTGKTDFGLFIAETLLKMPSMNSTMITEVATNIETDTFKQIYDLVSLRQWLYSSNRRKLYILDEASEHLPSRRAMTRKSVSFIQLIPEISKAHARMIVIGHQLLTIDKTFLDDVWCRGVFIKKNLKKAQLFSGLIVKPMSFRNIPPTNIKFDPYAIAPFQETLEVEKYIKDEDMQVAWKWCNGASWRTLFKHPMDCNRKMRAVMKKLLEKAFTDSPIKS